MTETPHTTAQCFDGEKTAETTTHQKTPITMTVVRSLVQDHTVWRAYVYIIGYAGCRIGDKISFLDHDSFVMQMFFRSTFEALERSYLGRYSSFTFTSVT